MVSKNIYLHGVFVINLFKLFNLVRTKTLNIGLETDACIEIPSQASPERGTLHALWPRSLVDRSLVDCDCSVFLGGEFSLQQCDCYDETIYTIEVQADEERGKNKLCFRNLTSSMNNTRIHFFHETTECSLKPQGFGTNQNFQRFVSSYLIILRGKFNIYCLVTFNDHHN